MPAKAALICRQANARGSGSPGRFTAITFWSSWTSQTPISTAQGDDALTRAILGVRARGGIVVVNAHRPSALAGVDNVLVLLNGQLQAFGPKDQVLRARRSRMDKRPR